MSLNGLSVCVTVLVLALHLNDPSTQVPSWLKKLCSGFRMVLRNKNTKQIEAEPKLDGNKDCLASNTKYPDCEEQVKPNKNLEPIGKGTLTWKEVAGIVNGIFVKIFIGAQFLIILVCSMLWYQVE